jgi:type VI secretion system secreted protein Hcp
MAADIFLKIDDIKGESVDDKHKDEVDVLSWSWGMTQSGTSHVGGGSGTSRVSVRDITVVKHVDRASPNLMKLCCNGTHFKLATLIVRKAGGKAPLEYLKLKLHNGLISSLTTGEVDQDGRMVETIGLNFAAFECDYTPQKPDGSGDAPIPAKWNIAKNNESVP